MPEETVVAESSAAAATETPKFTQFDSWDDEGNPVVAKKESPKPAGADSAAADASKEAKNDKTEDAADSAAKKTQENHRKPDTRSAEARIKELNATNKRLEKELEDARKPRETKPAESSTAKPEPKPAELPPTRPRPSQNEKGADGKPKYASYDDYVEDLADWKAEQRMAARDREQQNAQFLETVKQKLTEARGRYADYDSVAKPVHQELMKPDIPREVFAVINDSPVLPDLLYAIGGSAETKADFLEACRTNPGKALRVALLMEQEITKELAKAKGAVEKKAGEGEAETTPATPKPRAPKPPAEVGGRGTPGEDVLISAAKAGDFRTFDAEQTRRAVSSRR